MSHVDANRPRPVSDGPWPEEKQQHEAVARNFAARGEAQGLGLVAETLLMAVLLHALFALVFIDLRFTAFLNGAHGLCDWG